jgi:hypothetical protein
MRTNMTDGLLETARARCVKIVIESDARHSSLTREIQDNGVIRPIQTCLRDVKRLPSFCSKQGGDSRSEALIEQDPLHATRFRSANSSSTEAAA